MGKIDSGAGRHEIPSRAAPTLGEQRNASRRTDQLARIVDECIEAKTIADALGEKLLAYLLAMAIQESRAAMRVEVESVAIPAPAPLPKRAPRARRR